jgi:hypothetical protein
MKLLGTLILVAVTYAVAGCNCGQEPVYIAIWDQDAGEYVELMPPDEASDHWSGKIDPRGILSANADSINDLAGAPAGCARGAGSEPDASFAAPSRDAGLPAPGAGGPANNDAGMANDAGSVDGHHNNGHHRGWCQGKHNPHGALCP